jgi:hypothetical protein
VLQGCMTDDKKPTHIAYGLRRDGRRARWVEIGVAALHGDGQGFDVLLDRVPVPGCSYHIMVRAAAAKPPEPPAASTLD